MILPHRNDAIHKAWLSRILAEIADDAFLPSVLYFKEGTCATMLGWLDRFSVDIDFDYVGGQGEIAKTRAALERVFVELGLAVKDSSKNGIQYFLRYDGVGRTTIQIDTSFPVLSANTYAPQRLSEIDRVLVCQTRETMFGNKLLALMERGATRGSIAGRDAYDIHHFFLCGYTYSDAVIQEGSGQAPVAFFEKLLTFVREKVTDRVLSEDLNFLLPAEQFRRMRKMLKGELLTMLNDEITRLSASV